MKMRKAPRRATKGDMPGIRDIYQKSFRLYVPRLGLKAVPDDADLLDRIRDSDVFVVDGIVGGQHAGDRTITASDEGEMRPVATVVLRTGGTSLWISNLAVLPSHQHRGLGRSLLMFAEMRAYRNGLRRLETSVFAAMWETHPLYVRMGFDEIDRYEVDNTEVVQFAKRLGSAGKRGG